MPIVILRGSKRPGHKVSRLVLEGSSSNPVREAFVNGEPFEVSDEEFASLDAKYVLEPADDKPEDNDQEPSEPSGLVAASEQDET